MSRIRLALVLAAIASLVIAASAFAAKVTGGTTTITPSSATTALLSANHITVTPLAPATSSSGALTFPITHGQLDVKTLHGRLILSGGLKLSNGTKTVDVRRLEITSTKRGAYVWGLVRHQSHRACAALRRHPRRAVCHVVTRLKYVRLAKISSGSVSGSTFTGTLTITQTTANVIDRLAGSKVVAGGATLGTISIAPKIS